jgi:hypothetical protein
VRLSAAAAAAVLVLLVVLPPKSSLLERAVPAVPLASLDSLRLSLRPLEDAVAVELVLSAGDGKPVLPAAVMVAAACSLALELPRFQFLSQF